MNKLLEKKKAALIQLESEVRELEDIRRLKEEYPVWKKLEGRIFKYKNSYSLPQVTSDYWYNYRKIRVVKKSGTLVVDEFYIDKYGKLHVTIHDEISWRHHPMSSGWVECSLEEWKDALTCVVDMVKSLQEF